MSILTERTETQLYLRKNIVFLELNFLYVPLQLYLNWEQNSMNVDRHPAYSRCST